jgi:hypothetical protein
MCCARGLQRSLPRRSRPPEKADAEKRHRSPMRPHDVLLGAVTYACFERRMASVRMRAGSDCVRDKGTYCLIAKATIARMDVRLLRFQLPHRRRKHSSQSPGCILITQEVTRLPISIIALRHTARFPAFRIPSSGHLFQLPLIRLPPALPLAPCRLSQQSRTAHPLAS